VSPQPCVSDAVDFHAVKAMNVCDEIASRRLQVSSSAANPPMPALTVSQAFAAALQHHHAGRLPEAEALYRQVLAVQPNHAAAVHSLGLVAHQLGRYDLAVEWIRQSLALNPNEAAAHSNLGEAYRFLRRYDEAIASYQRAIQLAAPHPQTYHNLGLALAEKGQFADAATAYRHSLKLRPDAPETLNNLGSILAGQGRLDQALGAFRRALELKPDFAEAYNNLGGALVGKGLLDEAVAAYRRAIEFRPGYAMAYYNLGRGLTEQGSVEEAMAAYQRALELKPDYLNALSNLGNLLKDQDRLDEAEACYERSLALDPSFSYGHLNMGVVSLQRRHFPEAEASYRRAIACEADLAEAHFNLGMLLLMLGRYEEGWHEYEWRWLSCARTHVRNFPAPQWDGTPAPGKTILIHAEQGYGDVLLFARYLPLVRARSQAARVILECRSALVPLLEQLRSRDIEIVTRGASDSTLPSFDLHLPLFTMPLALRSFAPLAPLAPPLVADAGLRVRWRERLGSPRGLRVGLAWAGNPLQDDDRHRSLTPEKLAPLLCVPGIHFVSLQVEPRGSMPPVLAAAGVSDFTAEIRDFSDSAALVAELDLIITVDTATAHLAGTLGRPTWVLLTYAPFWPYGVEREETPWYPTMRLFRQRALGAWEEVLERVAAALHDWKG